jgi:hypothetical protein
VNGRRRALFGLTALVIALGLACRHPAAPPFVQLYCGDVLWGALFFVLFAWFQPQRSSLQLGLCAIITTELIELSQLYQAPWALELRATRLGGLLLGHGFLWSDVLCVALGAVLAVSADLLAKSCFGRNHSES